MSDPRPGDLVKVIRVNTGEEQFLNRVGTLVMVVGDKKCVIAFDDGSGTSLTIGQLKKIS